MLRYNATEMRLLKYLFEKSQEDSYLYKIAKGMNRDMSVILDNLRKLERKGMVKSRKVIEPRTARGPTRFYYLTDRGEAFAWAFLNPDKLVTLYRKEAIAGLGLSGLYGELERIKYLDMPDFMKAWKVQLTLKKHLPILDNNLRFWNREYEAYPPTFVGVPY